MKKRIWIPILITVLAIAAGVTTALIVHKNGGKSIFKSEKKYTIEDVKKHYGLQDDEIKMSDNYDADVTCYTINLRGDSNDSNYYDGISFFFYDNEDEASAAYDELVEKWVLSHYEDGEDYTIGDEEGVYDASITIMFRVHGNMVMEQELAFDGAWGEVDPGELTPEEKEKQELQAKQEAERKKAEYEGRKKEMLKDW